MGYRERSGGSQGSTSTSELSIFVPRRSSRCGREAKGTPWGAGSTGGGEAGVALGSTPRQKTPSTKENVATPTGEESTLATGVPHHGEGRRVQHQHEG